MESNKIEMCEDMTHVKEFYFACEKCYKDREKHLGCPYCKNIDEFCIKCLKPVNKEKLKQEILNKIFITHEESLDIREKELKSKERYYKDLEKVNKEFKEKFRDLRSFFGKILRKFELKEKISSEEKKVLGKLWDYIIKEVPKNFEIPKTKRERKKHLDLKLEKHLEIIRKIKEERKKLKQGSDSN